MYRPRENIALYITVAAIAVITVVFCVVYSGTAMTSLDVQLRYYFIYQYTADNAVSASSLSDAVDGYGGAAYILSRDNKYYVTVACYYDETSAASVCFGLKSCGIECDVLSVEISEKPLSRSANAELYLGDINTLEQLGKIVYALANSLDKGDVTQSGAGDTLASVRSGLEGLYSANTDNAFSDELVNLLYLCDDIVDSGYIYSKSLRRLQIAIIDSILSADLTAA